MDGFGLAAAGRSLLRDYDDVDRMLPDRDRLAAVQDRACRSNALRLIRCIGVPNGIAVKLQLFHSLSGKPRNVQGEQAVFGEGLVHNGEINRAVSGRGHRVYGGDVLIDDLIGHNVIFLVDVDAEGQAADIVDGNAAVAVYIGADQLGAGMVSQHLEHIVRRSLETALLGDMEGAGNIHKGGIHGHFHRVAVPHQPIEDQSGDDGVVEV